MIFITLGTQDKPFDRLLKLIDEEIDKGLIKDEVIVQSGFTNYESSNMKIYKYLNTNKFNKYMRESDLVITHAGVGSIFTALSYDKKIMAMARLKEFGEQHNDHQLDIIESFTNEGYILSFSDERTFEESYKKLSKFKPKVYESNTKNMLNLIEDYIDNN